MALAVVSWEFTARKVAANIVKSYLPLFLPPAAGGYQSPSGTQAVPPPQS